MAENNNTATYFDVCHTPTPTGHMALDEFDLLPNDFDYGSLDMTDLLEQSFATQIGGGRRREATPEELTPTRLRTRINPSLRGQGTPFIDNVKIRRAQMAPAQEVPLPSSVGNETNIECPPNVVPSHSDRSSPADSIYLQQHDSAQTGELNQRLLAPPHAHDIRSHIGPGIPPLPPHPSDFGYQCTEPSRVPYSLAHDFRPPSAHDGDHLHHHLPYPSSRYADLPILPHEERLDNYFACKFK
jgi:hypothetical protein